MNNLGYYNGKIGLIEEMMIPMNDRACYFGDGIYDATCCKNNVVYLCDEHIDRFFNNCGLFDIKLNFSKAWLKETLFSLVKQVDADEKFVYWQASRGTAKRNHIYPKDVTPNLQITVTPAPLKDIYAKINLITLEDKRFLYCNVKTINLLPSVLAAQAAEEAGCDESVFHRADIVTECAHSNVSILKGGKFRTHPADCHILPGIARAHIIKACKKLNIPVDERAFTLEELMDADEVIVSSSSKFCLSAGHIDAKPVGGKAPELLAQIQKEVHEEFLRGVGLM